MKTIFRTDFALGPDNTTARATAIGKGKVRVALKSDGARELSTIISAAEWKEFIGERYEINPHPPSDFHIIRAIARKFMPINY